MFDFNASNQSESIDTETGEIRYRKTLPETVVAEGTSKGKSPKLPGKNSQKRPSFLKVTPIGAHVMAMARLTGRQYQILFMLIRDANYAGMCFTHPDHLASELGMDSSDARKALKVLEEKSIVKRKIMPNKGHSYCLNPRFINASDSDDVDRAYAIWASK